MNKKWDLKTAIFELSYGIVTGFAYFVLRIDNTCSFFTKRLNLNFYEKYNYCCLCIVHAKCLPSI